MITAMMTVLGQSAQQPLKAGLLNFEGPDMIIVLVIVLLLFGPKNLPKLAQSIGKSVRELKNGLHGMTDEEKEAANPTAENSAKPEAKSAPVASAMSAEAKKVDDTHTTTV